MLTVHLETPAGVKHHLLACGLLEAQGFQREGLTEGGRSRASQQLVLTNRYKSTLGFPQNPPANSGDMGSFPRLGRSPGGRNGTPLQYSCLENPMDRKAWWAIVHGVTKELNMTL